MSAKITRTSARLAKKKAKPDEGVFLHFGPLIDVMGRRGEKKLSAERIYHGRK